MKIGFFGGCFNPPTIAHITLAKKALKEAKLDKVIFVPIGDFYKKKELLPAIERYNMLKIECEDIENIEVSKLELDIKENLYAIDAFKLIKENFPNDELYFIMGADNFKNIMNWKDSEKLIQEYQYIVLERQNINIEEYIENNLEKYKNKILLIKNEEYKDFSSSKFREIIKKNKNAKQDIISDRVMNYIKQKNLF